MFLDNGLCTLSKIIFKCINHTVKELNHKQRRNCKTTFNLVKDTLLHVETKLLFTKNYSIPKNPLTFCHTHCNEEEIAAQHTDEVMMRSGNDWRNVLIVVGFPLGIKEVIAYRSRYNTLPVFFHKNIPEIKKFIDILSLSNLILNKKGRYSYCKYLVILSKPHTANHLLT